MRLRRVECQDKKAVTEPDFAEEKTAKGSPDSGAACRLVPSRL